MIYEKVLKVDEILLNENQSDSCLNELFSNCNVSLYCWMLMTGCYYTDYPLTHQIFYIEIAEKV